MDEYKTDAYLESECIMKKKTFNLNLLNGSLSVAMPIPDNEFHGLSKYFSEHKGPENHN